MVRSVLRHRLAPQLSRALIASQLALGLPVGADTGARPPTDVRGLTQAQAPVAPQPISVNRRVPQVAPAPSEPQFSATPTAAEIFRARVFPEPLVPIGGEPNAGENHALAQALLAFHRSGGQRWQPSLGQFLLQYPGTVWRASLLANLGTVHLRAHAYSRALEAWDEAWRIARVRTDATSRAVAHAALADWLTLASSFGDSQEVRKRLAEAETRGVSGAAGVKIARVRENLALIARHPDQALACASEALLALLRERGMPEPAFLTDYVAKREGTSLLELRDLARRAGLSVQMVRRDDARELPVQGIVHLTVGHFVVIRAKNGDRYDVIDRARGQRYWIEEETLFEEMSGFALILSSDPPAGWQVVEDAVAATVRGSGPVCPDGSPPPSPPCPQGDPTCCPTGGPGGGGGGGGGGGPNGGGCGGGRGCGMPVYTLQPVTASLILHDSPAGYTPPRGPSVPLTLSYHQREALQPQLFTQSHVGPKWTFTWLRFVQEVPVDVLGTMPPHVWVMQPPGGREVFSQPDAQGVYPAHWSSRAVLVRVTSSPVRYERRLPDGSVEVYASSDGGPEGQRRVFLTELIDPLQQRLQFTWDAQSRLVAITDAVGQVTTLAYEDAADPLRITRITDPFSRSASLTYTDAGQLASITDVLGMTSSFTYGANDFVTTMRTPYGTTAFRHEPNPLNHLNLRFIETTDPLGGTEHLEFQYQTAALAASEPASEVPAGFTAWNTDLNRYNTFYWSKRAWMLGPGDLSKAEVTHWMTQEEWPGWQSYSAVPHSVKKPLESRVWYAYPGQVAGQEFRIDWSVQPSRVGRVLDDGTSQVYETTYNTQGAVLTQTDPVGRQTSYTYAADGTTLTEIRQTGNGANDVLAMYANFTALDQPQTVTDAAGQVTSFTYNAAGQPLTVTNAKSEATTYAYDTNGRVSSITGPVGGAVTSFTYDALGRQRTVTDPDGYVLTFDYDALDRVVRTLYPDGTDTVTTYDRLDLSSQRDREGRITRFYHDAVRRLTATRDPLGRTVTQNWCVCGGLDALIDANGNKTRWERDLQGRLTREVRADGTTDTTYAYGARSGRLLTTTDPKDQVTTYTYAADGQMLSTSFTNAVIPTPGVTYTYEAAYPRVATMQDGIGTTTYTYHPAGQLGAGQVASVDGPLTDDTITYTYDPLGRVEARAINGPANTVTWAFDALGRITSEANVLGTFTYGYDGPTSRVEAVTYPNGQTSAYTYYPNAGNRRLQTIHHKLQDDSTLSKFDYTYSATGDILTWRQEAGTEAVSWSYVYDTAGQLLGAEKRTADVAATLLQRYAYTYDPGGNRTSEQIDDVVVGATYDELNRLVSQQPGGPLMFAGTTNEPAKVTVDGKLAPSMAGNGFRVQVPVGSGTSTVMVAATDPSGNTASQAYEVDSNGSGRTFTYDANGNLTADGTRTFEWDARNQLVAVTVGTHRSEFVYDALQRRVRVVEKENGVMQADTKVVWCRDEICEQRAADGVTVIRRAVSRGEQRSGVARLFASDHLGSVTDVTDHSAALIARYELDPWGRRVLVAGTDATDVGFTGHDVHSPGGVVLALYRAYDPELGRWLSGDPLGDVDGPNRYAYVSNRPLGMRDMLGLQGMNASEARLCITNPRDCLQVRGCRNDANNATLKKFGRQGHNDTSDAFRHCYWSCCMAQKIGAEEAKRFGDAHENFPGNPCEERDMDFYNNDVGRRVGSSNPKGDCGQLCDPKDLQCAPKKCKP